MFFQPAASVLWMNSNATILCANHLPGSVMERMTVETTQMRVRKIAVSACMWIPLSYCVLFCWRKKKTTQKRKKLNCWFRLLFLTVWCAFFLKSQINFPRHGQQKWFRSRHEAYLNFHDQVGREAEIYTIGIVCTVRRAQLNLPCLPVFPKLYWAITHHTTK